jgi:hypothetical protein
MSNRLLERLMDNQQDAINRFSNTVSNLQKLATVKRTEENIKRYYESAVNEWRVINETHAKLMEHESSIDDGYKTVFKAAQKSFESMEEFVRLHAPSLLPSVNPLIPEVLSDQHAGDGQSTSGEKKTSTTPTKVAGTTSSTDAPNTSEANSQSLLDMDLETKSQTDNEMTPMDEVNAANGIQQCSTSGNPTPTAFTGNVISSAMNLAWQTGVTGDRTNRTTMTYTTPLMTSFVPQTSSAMPAQQFRPQQQDHAFPIMHQQPMYVYGADGRLYPVQPPVHMTPQAPMMSQTSMHGQPSGNFQSEANHVHGQQTSVGEGCSVGNSQQTDPQWIQLMTMMANTQHQLANNQQQRNQRPGLRLPEISLQVFDGNIKNYRLFRDTFASVINRSHLTETERFALLRSKLSGPAADAIAALDSVEENYEAAWATLDKTFDNERLTIETNFQSLKNLPTSLDNSNSLLKLVQTFRGVRKNCQVLQVTADHLLVFLTMQNFDSKTQMKFEERIGCDSRMPTGEMLIEFIEHAYAVSLRNKNSFHSSSDERRKDKKPQAPITKAHGTTNETDARAPRKRKCFICSQEHLLKECPEFLSSTDREALLRRFKICIYCLKHKFDFKQPCKSRNYLRCDICQDQHVTEMHPTTKAFLCANAAGATSEVVLPTAVVSMIAANGETWPTRCLLDQCAQSNYVTEDFVQKLKLRKKRTCVRTQGVGGIGGMIKSLVTIRMQVGDLDSPPVVFKALVVRSVTGTLPSVPVHIDWSNYKEKLTLADPKFNKPASIPILLGSKVYSQVLLEGLRHRDGFLLQNTRLGWIVSGTNDDVAKSKLTSCHVSLSEVEQKILAFWDIPVAQDDQDEAEDELCTKLFKEKHQRLEDGRYVAPIPWKPNAPQLGDSYTKALGFYLAQERRLSKDPEHKKMSDDFMREYLELGHMIPIPPEKQRDMTGDAYYIPHFSIMKKDAVTTKLRNVFNASSSTSNGLSLNDCILPGPKLQTHIFDIITRIRQFEFIFSGDVTKMFRQIQIPEKDRDMFRILWRPSVNLPVGEYYATTVTYGVESSPWQSIAVMHQTADDNAPNENIKAIIKESFYVDDLFHGADSIAECQQIIEDVTATLEAGKLPMTKWVGNHPDVLAKVDPSRKMAAYTTETTVKTLGLRFSPSDDCFGFKFGTFDKIKATKRGFLSVAASLYDPIGWILPVVMWFRIMIQGLWEQQLAWDDKVDDAVYKKFILCVQQLSALHDFKVPRWMGTHSGNEVTLVGFSDASKAAFCAVVYSRVRKDNVIVTQLLASRGRVTPLKTKRIEEKKLCTIPKAELEGLLLLTDLLTDVRKCFKNLTLNFKAYVDSMIVVHWIRNPTRISNKTVARKVKRILHVLGPNDVDHVRSEDNPADPGSRGLEPIKFMQCEQWQRGPSWLKEETLPTTVLTGEELVICNATLTDPDTAEPSASESNSESEETSDSTLAYCHVSTVDDDPKFMERFSKFDTIVKVIARCRRWRTKAFGLGPLTSDEITIAKTRLLIFQQKCTFSAEFKCLKKGKPLPARHWMLSLSPFISNEEADPTKPAQELIRVGGRISRAQININQQHPILLTKCHLVDLIIHKTHRENCHSGPTLTDRLIREQLWVPSMKSRIQKIIRSCTACVRWRASTGTQAMADLPADRLNPAPIFQTTGVDLAGPFMVKASSLRFDTLIKVWVAVFVCMVSKAVHLEVVADLSTKAFLDAFSRFTGRRNCPTKLWSDNGTNFCGASRVMQEGWKKICQEGRVKLAIQEIEWHHIPVLTPHQGGLWEAAVKSMKFFIKRVANTETITRDEFATLLCRIEGIMNSRPLYPDPTDPDVASALTPFHFTSQRGWKQSPSDAADPEKTPLLKRWRQMMQTQMEFWERFSKEYLSSLQKRYKWKHPTRNLEVGDVVLLQEPNTKPGEWPMGRIVETYPDSKGQVRNVDVKTKNAECSRRSTNHLVPLMAEDLDVTPPPRRSTRRKPEVNSSLLTRILICWLALNNTIQGEFVLPLGAGVHVQRFGNISIKAFTLEFSVHTSINLTSDLATINTSLEDLNTFCASYKDSNYTDLFKNCQKFSSTLKLEAEEAMQHVTTTYLTRNRRSIAVLARGAVKFAPEILLASGMAYQVYENHQMSSQITNIKEKVRKVSSLLLNVNEVEFESVDKELYRIIDAQQQTVILAEINNYAAGVQALLSRFKAKHQNVIDIRPVDELIQHLAKHSDELSGYMLPPVAHIEDLFSLNKITKSLVNHCVCVTFHIPLIAEIFNKFAIISIPNDDGQAVELDNGKNVMMIALDKENSSMIFLEDATYLGFEIYDHVEKFNPTACLNEILLDKGNISVLCNVKTTSQSKNKFFPLGEDLWIIIKDKHSPTKLECFGKITTITHHALLYIPGCSVDDSHQQIYSTLYGNETVINSVPTIEIQPPAIIIHHREADPRLQKLRKDLDEMLGENWKIDNKQIGFLISAGVIFAILVVAVVAAIARHNRKTADVTLHGVKTPSGAWSNVWIRAPAPEATTSTADE